MIKTPTQAREALNSLNRMYHLEWFANNPNTCLTNRTAVAHVAGLQAYIIHQEEEIHRLKTRNLIQRILNKK